MKARIVSIAIAGVMIAAGAAPAQAKKAPRCAGKKATIVSGAKLIKGTAKSDVIVVKGARAHKVVAGGGNDIICGSSGRDTILGGAGNDRVYGMAGNDMLSGGVGNDILAGGAGTDELDGNDGIDVLSGGTGMDVKHLGSGDTDADESDADITADDSVLTDLTAEQQALAGLLQNAVAYLAAGILAGDITGTGTQAMLPSAPDAGMAMPSDPRIKHVVWSVTGEDIEACVDGSTDGVDSFKVRLDPRDGAESNAFESGSGDITQTNRTFTTGVCSSNALGSNVPRGAASNLELARDRIVAGVLNGAVAGDGDTDFALYVGTTTPSDNYLIDRVLTDNVVRVQWQTTAVAGGTSTAVCVDAVVDPYAEELDFYSFNGTVTVLTVSGTTKTTVTGTVVHDFCAPMA